MPRFESSCARENIFFALFVVEWEGARREGL